MKLDTTARYTVVIEVKALRLRGNLYRAKHLPSCKDFTVAKLAISA